jgi:hypothetical protein
MSHRTPEEESELETALGASDVPAVVKALLTMLY